MSRDYDSLNRLPSRRTDRIYTFELTDGSTVSVWADGVVEAEEIVDRQHPWVGSYDIARLRWICTTGPAGNRIPTLRSRH